MSNQESRRAQPEVEASQADPYALDDDDVARFPNDANVVIVHKDYYWKLRGCEDVCAALGAEPAAQHAESGAQAAISDTEIHNHLGHWGVLPTKTGEPERVTAGREKLLVTAIQELLSKVYAATRLRDVRSLALEGNRLINGALAAQSQGAHSAPGTPEAPKELGLDIAVAVNQRIGKYIAANKPALMLLNEEELAALYRFQETCEDSDSGGYDVDKEMMKRLAAIGAIESKGFGRYQLTEFGDFVVERAAQLDGGQGEEASHG